MKYLSLFILLSSLNILGQAGYNDSTWLVKPRGYFRYAIPFAGKDREVGQRLSLTGMGSIGGRHEEADWLELGSSFHLNRIMGWDKDAPIVKLHTLFSMFPTQGPYIHLATGAGIQELYVTVDDYLWKKPVQFWAGLRYYRTQNIEACDYFNFNNLSGPTAGLKIGNSQIAIITDSPFINNSGGQYGTAPDPYRTRLILALQHQQKFGEKHLIDFLTEYHTGSWEIHNDSTGQTLNEGIAQGWVLGLRHHYQITPKIVNRASIRYGAGIANGPNDDNWSSRTFVTVGNPNDQGTFKGANAWHLTNNIQFQASNLFNFETYVIYRKGKGADNAVEFRNRTNQKEDLTLGSRVTWFLSNKFHFITEGSYQTKRYTDYTASNTKVSEAGTATVSHFAFGPMFVPNSKRDMFARPVFRVIYAVAFYNDYAKQERLSDYLMNVDGEVGQYIGLKTEFWF